MQKKVKSNIVHSSVEFDFFLRQCNEVLNDFKLFSYYFIIKSSFFPCQKRGN